MSKTPVTAIFDVGKTNKKFFLFDQDFREVHREYTQLDTIADEDGYPTEDLNALVQWMKQAFDSVLKFNAYEITGVNFSSYGASLVHIDKDGTPLTPLYNYTKPIDQDLIRKFYDTYGPENVFSRQTGSPPSGMLNSGLQLYWLKYKHPKIFKKIKFSLHLPQYLSYVFTGTPVTEYTSLGCHTGLWDYENEDYHPWVYKEELDQLFPPLVSTETSFIKEYKSKPYNFGVGIHDSSSALLPYISSKNKPFILVSTGTWSVALNPFATTALTSEEVNMGCLNYMRLDSSPVKSSRIYLGNEYKAQVKELSAYYKVSKDYHKSIGFKNAIYYEIIKDYKPIYRWKYITDANMPEETEFPYDTFEEAYHHLMIQLVDLQIEHIELIAKDEDLNTIYVDGGFSDNSIYIELLSDHFSHMKLKTTDSSLGSALGAAIAISDSEIHSEFLKKNYALKKHVPLISK